MEEEERMRIMTKANFFCKNQKPVHVVLKSGRWKNGTIDEIGSDFFIMEERLQGSICVFFMEIQDIEKYIEKGDIKSL